MTTEVMYLAWGAALVLLHIVVQASLGTLDSGLSFNMGPRDSGAPQPSLYAGRASRALHNILETFAVFAALALALTVSSKAGGLGATGAMVWFWARVVYLPVYLAGVPVLRTLVWAVSIVGIVMMLIKLLG